MDMQDHYAAQNATESVPAMRKSKLAITALILGIPGVCFFPLGIVALVFGIIALVLIADPQRRLSGKAAALTGTILGGASIVLLPVLLILIGILLPALNAARSTAMIISDKNNLFQIGTAVNQYTVDHDTLPDHPRQLVADVGITPDLFISPAHDPSTVLDRGDTRGSAERYGSYVFLLSGTPMSDIEYPSHTVIAYTAKVNDQPRQRSVLFLDGHVESVVEEDMMYFLPMDVDAASLDGP